MVRKWAAVYWQFDRSAMESIPAPRRFYAAAGLPAKGLPGEKLKSRRKGRQIETIKNARLCLALGSDRFDLKRDPFAAWAFIHVAVRLDKLVEREYPGL